MNFSALSATEKMAVYASLLVAVLGLWSLSQGWGGLLILAVLAAIGMLLVLFAPALMPRTKLPGSKGSLMLVTGGVAAVVWALSALTWIGWIFGHLATIDTLQFVVGLLAALAMGWFGWQAFQAEGGKLEIGARKG
jgi:hypothetical protein